MKCPKSDQRSTRWPGTLDQCEHCGRMSYTRKRDGCYTPHDLPAEMGTTIVERNEDLKAARERKR